MSRINIEDFSKFVLSSGSHRIWLSRRKSQALVTLLALTPTNSETRSRIAQLLWSEGSEAAARTSLRQEVAQARSCVVLDGVPLIEGDKQTIWFTGIPVKSHSVSILEDLSAGHISDFLLGNSLPQDLFLSHLQGLDPEFDLWLTVERAAFERKCLEYLTPLIDPRNPEPVRQRAAQALVNIDPTHESANRTMLGLLVQHGAHAKAQSLYENYCRVLREDYGLEPAFKIPAAVGPAAPAASVASAGLPADTATQRPLIIARTLAGPDAGNVSVYNALRSGLLGALVRFRDWSVRELAVDEPFETADGWFELRFSGQMDGGTAILTTSLVLMPESEIFWSEALPHDMELEAAKHKGMIRRLATSLNLEISARRLERALARPVYDRSLYDQLLVAKQHLHTWRANDEATAENAIRAILARWPDHSPSLSSLVEILNTRHHVFPGLFPDRKRSQEALELAQRAGRLSPRDNRVQLTLGWCHLMVGRPEQARHYFDMALRLNDNDPLTLISSAMGLCFSGDKPAAQSVAAQAIEASAGGEPIHWAYHACIRFYCDDIDGALEAGELAVGSAHFIGGMRAAIAAAAGDTDGARQIAKLFCEEISQHWYSAGDPTPLAIRKWLVSSFPISDQADREKLSLALDAAGLM